MGLTVAEDRITEAERELGRKLPDAFRRRLMRKNGGEVEVSGYPSDDAVWQLHPVRDPSDRKRAGPSANDIVRETRQAHSGPGLSMGAVVIANNGTGDLLLLLANDNRPYWWDHETTEVRPVTTDWS